MTGPIKITQMDLAGPLDGTEFIPIVQGGVNKRIALSSIPAFSWKTQSFVGAGPYQVNVAVVNRLLGAFVGGQFYEPHFFFDIGVQNYQYGGTVPISVLATVVIVFQGA
jgi:hypothetical protein